VTVRRNLPASSLRFGALAAALTLLSGAVMMSAGYVGETGSWTIAGLIAIAGGFVILAAFAVARRTGQSDGRRAAPGGRFRARPSGAMAGTLLSGGVMVFAGRAGSAWGWGIAAALATVGGLVIGAAFAADWRARRPKPNLLR